MSVQVSQGLMRMTMSVLCLPSRQRTQLRDVRHTCSSPVCVVELFCGTQCPWLHQAQVARVGEGRCASTCTLAVDTGQRRNLTNR